MSADTVFRQTFLTEVTQFITQVMNDPVIEQASFGLLIFLCAILYFRMFFCKKGFVHAVWYLDLDS